MQNKDFIWSAILPFSYFKYTLLWPIKGSFEWPFIQNGQQMASDQQLFCTLYFTRLLRQTIQWNPSPCHIHVVDMGLGINVYKSTSEIRTPLYNLILIPRVSGIKRSHCMN